MNALITWYKGLPTWARVLLFVPAIVVFIGGIVIGVWFGRRSDSEGVHQDGVGSGDSSISGLATQIGRVESDAATASRQNTELGKGIDRAQDIADGISSDNRRLEQEIAGARKSADDLGQLLGIKKD
jgi:hypothetical protein